ncbi:serine dehydratase subunit alpha family protein, partial [bacterium]|nr:serine dehydratase subunit alpha family protein [bacterium]
REKMIEAAMLAHLITALAAQDAGHLSALCGCAIKAGMGAAAGVAYLLGGNLAQITDAINRLAACPTGMICDGAKECCASKLETAAGKATECAYMAMGGRSLAIDNGIICAKVEDTIRAVGQISYSMVSTDATIVKILQNKA